MNYADQSYDRYFFRMTRIAKIAYQLMELFRLLEKKLGQKWKSWAVVQQVGFAEARESLYA
jgi:hypothetical protein